MSLLEVENLSVEFASRRGVVRVLDNVSLSLQAGEFLGMVGESGAGKSMTGNAVLGLIDPPGEIVSGDIRLAGESIINKPEAIRGSRVSMIFQDPLSSLNPLKTIGSQLVETIELHTRRRGVQSYQRAVELMQQIGVDAERLSAYPHQFSGGMRQRVVIALALASEPEIILADEPTTALDVSVQAQVLDLLRELCKAERTAVILITHDMGVIGRWTDRVCVMYKGQLIETGSTEQIICAPEHPYTKSLIAATPTMQANVSTRLFQVSESLSGSASDINGVDGTSTQEISANGDQQGLSAVNFVEINSVSRRFGKRHLFGKSTIVQALDDVSLTIKEGQTYALVGESGSGKSTLARIVVGVDDASSGVVKIAGHGISTSMPQVERRDIQMIFQSPYASLNPRWKVRDLVAEPLKAFGITQSNHATVERVVQLLEQVGLHADDVYKFPHEFSGGQRQRISIARALSSNPKFIVCDEPTSALDVSVQAQVLNLLKDLQTELGLTYLFITHDLPVVRIMAHQIGVLKQGKLVEEQNADELFANPQHEYTKGLLEAAPVLDKGAWSGQS